MNNVLFDEDRNLSESETVIMKAVWNYNTSTESDISVLDLIKILREKYGKDYARTTVVTFLLKLSDKGFVRTYRKSKLSYVHIMKEEEEYKEKLMKEDIDFWYGGSIEKFKEILNNIEKTRGDTK